MAAYMALGTMAVVEWSDSEGRGPGAWTRINEVIRDEARAAIITSVGIVIKHDGDGILLTMSRQGTDYVDSWLFIPKHAILQTRKLS